MALCLHRAVVVQAVEEAGAEVGGQLLGDAAAIADLGEVEQLEPALEYGLRKRRVLVRRRVRRRAGGAGLEVLEIEVGEERASRRGTLSLGTMPASVSERSWGSPPALSTLATPRTRRRVS